MFGQVKFERLFYCFDLFVYVWLRLFSSFLDVFVVYGVNLIQLGLEFLLEREKERFYKQYGVLMW